MLHTVADLMTPNPFSVKQDQSLRDAHDLMRTKGIRHIPVVDHQGALCGMLTQKVMVAEVMRILANYGPNALERKEKHTTVTEIMATDFTSLTPEQSLSDVAQFFVDNRHGCMPVINRDNTLLGILTSSDFVRLAAALLS
ncbi:CBS domain-containing protein [Pseudoalteromonas citrea]|uniref:CBS domain-containing protein n=1 Tax=Pseudoalteromonas citrea TaxID=43655 RepID=A0A5S3XQH9_9GAMM|nr:MULTISPECIES: CBS domain-containing protein [Pseudoalteromonas]TMO60059.1 CBS domain-containing protein [Pseudoalteromonas aurantia]TMP43568.1 CBS domain-containing protein [Pseudoalteromonas citrea]TMP59821.1 CBS domain-containing protein [Pseudoalteromonas citrea]